MTDQSLVLQFDETLATALDEFLSDGNYSAAIAAIRDNKYQPALLNNCSDTINVLFKYLNDENFDEKPQLFETAEQILKIVAEVVNPEEALLELLEIVETTGSDNVFTSTLKALQVCILRQKNNKARSLEWCLNSIQLYIGKLPISPTIVNQTEEKEAKLLEENPQVRRILSNYLMLFLFYEPILNDLKQKDAPMFRDTGIIRRNVFGCFLLQLLGKPLYYLDLTHHDTTKASTNTYSRQCVATIVSGFTSLFPDPFFLLDYIERRIRFPLKFKTTDGVYEGSTRDIFLMDEKLPYDAVGVFYYLILAENLMPDTCPKIYSHLYLFERNLYLLTEMLKLNENSLHSKAIRLANVLLDRLALDRIQFHNLETEIYKTFTTQLIRIIVESPNQQNSQNSALLLKRFLFQFDDDGRFFLIRKLFEMVEHNPLFGYLVHLYKSMIAEALDSEQNNLFSGFTGDAFSNILLKYICKLKNGTETDLIQNSDHIITSLNMIRYIAVRDHSNKTGFWNKIGELKEMYLEPLRIDVDMSRAHYKAEEDRLKTQGKLDGFTTEIIPKALNTFDLIESLMSRVNECIRKIPIDC